MSAALMRSECRKFAPNIFNKSKCTNCFRQKEEHSAEALESNRGAYNVSAEKDSARQTEAALFVTFQLLQSAGSSIAGLAKHNRILIAFTRT
ncbi:Uncharacterized protein GBIM_05114 [Gryllus bimaculatus]|nr:Uncharacterized protein GBIM_05114 [Gryllus bimaculatus]